MTADQPKAGETGESIDSHLRPLNTTELVQDTLEGFIIDESENQNNDTDFASISLLKGKKESISPLQVQFVPSNLAFFPN